MNKIFIVLTISCFLTLSACQKTPEQTIENNNGIKISQQETFIDIAAETTATSDTFEVPEHVSETYNEEDYTVTIDSDILFPNATITSGTLESKEISLETIKEVVNPDAEWVERDDAYYILLPESEQKPDQIDYIISLSHNEYLPEQVIYDTTYSTEDFPYDAELLEENAWTDEQKIFFTDARSYAENLLNQLNYSYSDLEGKLQGNETHWYASFDFNFAIDGIPTCNASSMNAENLQSTSGYISSTTNQTGSLILNGDYTVCDQASAELLSLDKIIECFFVSLGQGNAGQLLENVNITNIQLEYWVYENDLSYVPVWTFYMSQDGLDEAPICCINASTGVVLYQW